MIRKMAQSDSFYVKVEAHALKTLVHFFKGLEVTLTARETGR